MARPIEAPSAQINTLQCDSAVNVNNTSKPAIGSASDRINHNIAHFLLRMDPNAQKAARIIQKAVKTSQARTKVATMLQKHFRGATTRTQNAANIAHVSTQMEKRAETRKAAAESIQKNYRLHLEANKPSAEVIAKRELHQTKTSKLWSFIPKAYDDRVTREEFTRVAEDVVVKLWTANATPELKTLLTDEDVKYICSPLVRTCWVFMPGDYSHTTKKEFLERMTPSMEGSERGESLLEKADSLDEMLPAVSEKAQEFIEDITSAISLIPAPLLKFNSFKELMHFVVATQICQYDGVFLKTK